MVVVKGTTPHVPQPHLAENGEPANTLSEELRVVNEGGYSHYAAEQLGAIAGWSYSDFDTFKDIVSDHVGPGVDMMSIQVKNEPLLVQATAHILRTNDKRVIVVAFRGTELTNAVNWITNGLTEKKQFHETDVDVHSGFMANFDAVWFGQKGILQHLLHPEMIHPEYDYTMTREAQGYEDEQDELEAIYFCGHSLGGAMAFLAGLYLEKMSDNPASGLFQTVYGKCRGVYTYGAPMVVDDQHRDRCGAIGTLTFRHVFYNDLIPHLPPLSLGSFDHVGCEYRYHPSNGWVLRQSGFGFKSDRCTQVVSLAVTLQVGILDGVLDNINWLNFWRGEGKDWPVVGWLSLGYLKMPWSVLDHSPTGYISTLMVLPRNHE